MARNPQRLPAPKIWTVEKLVADEIELGGIPIVTSPWNRVGTVLSPLNTNDSLALDPGSVIDFNKGGTAKTLSYHTGDSAFKFNDDLYLPDEGRFGWGGGTARIAYFSTGTPRMEFWVDLNNHIDFNLEGTGLMRLGSPGGNYSSFDTDGALAITGGQAIDFNRGATAKTLLYDSTDTRFELNAPLAIAGQLDLTGGTHKITGVADGISVYEAVNRGQLDNAITGLGWTDPVEYANIISDADQGGIDPTGVLGETWIVNNWSTQTDNHVVYWDGTWQDLGLLASGDRTIVSDGTGTALDGSFVGQANEIGDYTTSWAFTAPVDGNAIMVTEGYHADAGYTYNGTAWVQFTGAGQINAGQGLTKSGNTLNVGAGTHITVNADDIEVDILDDQWLYLNTTNSKGIRFSGTTNDIEINHKIKLTGAGSSLYIELGNGINLANSAISEQITPSRLRILTTSGDKDIYISPDGTGILDITSNVNLRDDNSLFFDTAGTKSLLWDSTATRLEFNDDVYTSGSFIGDGSQLTNVVIDKDSVNLYPTSILTVDTGTWDAISIVGSISVTVATDGIYEITMGIDAQNSSTSYSTYLKGTHQGDGGSEFNISKEQIVKGSDYYYVAGQDYYFFSWTKIRVLTLLASESPHIFRLKARHSSGGGIARVTKGTIIAERIS